MHPELENLINIALIDNIFTEKEKEILYKKAKKLGVDMDEFEMEMEGIFFSLEQKKKHLPDTLTTSNDGKSPDFTQTSNAKSVNEDKPSQKRGFLRFLSRKYNLEKAYLIGIELLNEQGDETNKNIPSETLKKYLQDDMTSKEIEAAVEKAFDEIFSKFDKKQAYIIAVHVLKNKPYININKKETELLKYFKENMTFVEICNTAETAYKQYYGRYDKQDILEIAVPFIKGLGPVDSSIDFVQSTKGKRSKSEEQLLLYFTDDMNMKEIQEACKNAYLNEFGKVSWLGMGKREIKNPHFKLRKPPNEALQHFWNLFDKAGEKIIDYIP